MLKMWDSYADACVMTNPEVVVSYRTANFVLEEGLVDGSWIILSMNASGFMMDTNPLPRGTYMATNQFVRPQAFHINLDGQDLEYRLKYTDCRIERKDNKVYVAVTLESEIRPVKIIVHTLLDGTPVLTRYLEIINLKPEPSALAYLAIMSGGFQTQRLEFLPSDKLYRLGYVDDPRWFGEGDFHWHDLEVGETAVSGRYRRDRHRHPGFMLESLGSGETFIGQLAFSGGYSFKFDYNRDRVDNRRSMCGVSVAFEACVDAPAPLRIIDSGEHFTSPEFHLGCVFHGLDMAVNAMHEHIRKSVMLPPTRSRTGWLVCGIGPEYDMSREETLHAIDVAAEYGVEVFYIDAGWYTPPKREDLWWDNCGYWRYDKDRYPNGLEEIRDYAHSKGLLFGLWMDADRVGPGSDIWQNKRDKISKLYNGKTNPSGLLDNTNKEVCAWMKSEIEYVIGKYQLDFYRLDNNVDAREWLIANPRDGYLENGYLRYYENVYSMYKELRAEFPDVIFENCAGGGGRTDLGLVSCFTHTWVTDCQTHPVGFRITNGMTLFLPPETVNRLVFGQNSYVTADLDMMLRNALFAQACFGMIDPSRAEHNPNQIKKVQKAVQFYKDFVRPMHKDMWIYHHTPELSDGQPKEYGILEIAKKDGTQGMLGVFRLACASAESVRVCLRGVDEGKDYLVTSDNSGASFHMYGWQLATEGLTVRLGSSLTSELITYQTL